jgi:uncharacterized protein (DUF488 family)
MNLQEKAMSAGATIYTIGHSTHPIDRFLTLLKEHEIEALADIRRFPGSRKHPHFGREALARSLVEAGIEYYWLESLGGRRSTKQGRASNENLGLENAAFRAYADYMMTEEFREGIARLLEIAERKRTAIMCAESLYWRCHRRLVSDFLTVKAVTVEHIFPSGKLQPHKMTEGSQIHGGKLSYPGKALFD